MNNESKQVKELKEQLNLLKKIRMNDQELTGVENQVVEQVKTRKMKTHPSAGRYGESFQTEERGFMNVVTLMLILFLFQIGFIITLYLLFKN